ncbi:DUF1028 domain-containing protein [Alkalimonas delamerensis]|uniref:DUF1028 domain-containing protein n=1 Tax=Alkalimonas delamerensis TaxID=265981 RepID=A0ABT9GS29_9GAMM|nr:DUF1028 domain-containing protein [Alkalimonas delamerensis]MDP4529786.1 DUF1028 domain-containing protein [Alkalimonas delamerensis]
MIATYTIAVTEPESQSLAIATASNFLAVGSLVPWIKSDCGLLVSQSFANPAAAAAALDVLASSHSLSKAQEKYLEADKLANQRQFGLMTTAGEAVLYSGSDCTPEVESYQAPGMFCLGNMLKAGTVDAMALAYQQAKSDGLDLAAAMLSALRAGQQAGGDKRGKLAAAMLIKRVGAGYLGSSDTWLDLRVDAAADPVQDLEQLYRIFQLYYPQYYSQHWVDCNALDPEQQAVFKTLIQRLGQDAESSQDFSQLLAQHNLEPLYDAEQHAVSSLLLEHAPALLARLAR